MKYDEKNVCSFHNWYNMFEKNSFKSVFIPIPEDVLEYLRGDSVITPKEADFSNVKSNDIDEITYSQWDSDGEDDDEIEQPSFPQFSEVLKQIINRFDGKAFIKMNWSAPTDAVWVASNRSLKCTNLQDAYLLLKCSNKISNDLESTLKHHVVFKKWEDIHPGSEFRCFITDKELVAITQRSKSEFYKHILLNKTNIVTEIKEFFEDVVKENFLLNNYVLDLIWHSGSRIKIVDFAPLNIKQTEGYLFTTNEILNLEYNSEFSPEFRFISEEVGIQPSNLSRQFGLPIDLSGSHNLAEIIQNNVDLRSD